MDSTRRVSRCSFSCSARYRRPKARALAVSALAAASSGVIVRLQPAAAHAFTSLARRSSSSTSFSTMACADAHCSSVGHSSTDSTSKSDFSSLASAWSTSGTTGLTSQRKGQATLPVRWAVARTLQPCSTRSQQPRQKPVQEARLKLRGSRPLWRTVAARELDRAEQQLDADGAGVVV
eukprot:scaffold81952_cov61-Phaeocystis_antarctica.AAC.8